MSNDHHVVIALRPYIAGGAGAIFSSMCIHPIDLVKVRLQVASNTVGGSANGLVIARNVVKTEGVRGLFSGLSAAIARQAVYGTAKIGLHDSFSQTLRKMNNDQPIRFYQKTLSAMTAKSIPQDLCLDILFQMYPQIPASQNNSPGCNPDLTLTRAAAAPSFLRPHSTL